MSGNVSAQAVSFNTIPPNLRVPLFWAEVNNSQAGANQQNQRALIIGGSLNTVPLAPVFMPPPSGTGAVGAAQAAAAQFGRGSMLAEMVAYYRMNDPYTELWVLPVTDPGGGTAATGSLVISGTATANGTLSLYIGDVLLQVGVTSGQAAATVAAAIATAVNAGLFPVTATSASGTVSFTSKHKLIETNALQLGLNYLGSVAGQSTPAGLTVSVTGFSGGAGVPLLTGMAAALGVQDFDFIICGYNDPTALAACTAMMSDGAGRWSYINQLYGGVFAADVDTDANLLTLGGTVNDQHQVIWGAYGTPTPSWKVAAAATAAVVPSLVAQPNLPLQTLPAYGVMAPPAGPGALPSVSTMQSLLTTGISLLSWDRTGLCRVIRCVTTYQTNPYGVADQSYLDVGTLYTLMAVLRTLQAMVTQRYGRVLLVADGTPIGAGIAAVSPRTVRADLVAEYTILEDLGLTQNSTAFAAGLIVTINANDPTRLDVLLDPYLVSGLAIFAVACQFHLNTAVNNNAASTAAA
ncbi:phage tail sheath subtilisin-like domain-containing protein [Rhodopila sp.]|uniref:phage tail sheath subtilisin-like domain-containing protein n=1 Tax=Rhodopila sp. TaxID=2480087 RepID=UPI003D0C621B